MSQRTVNQYPYTGSTSVLMAGLVAVLVLLAGCGVEPESSANTGTLTVENGDRGLRFDTAPKRAVTMNHNGTELFLALGLEDRLVGTAWKDHEILPKYRDAYRTVPILSDRYPSLEVLLEANPDFVYGWQSAFQPPQGAASRSRLQSLGITPYLDRMYTDTGVTLEDTYDEIRTLGRIFRVEDRADSLVRSMRQSVREIRAKVPEQDEPLEVVVYNDGTDAFYAAGDALVADLLEYIGARNVLADDVDGSYGSVSWEIVIEENPDYIVVLDYGEVPLERKLEIIRGKPGMDSVKAIREDNFVVLPLASTFIGVRSVRALRTLAHGFYPEHVESTDPS